jgi:phosphomannomutase
MVSEIKFGTDGWRGKIAEDYTFLNVRRCSQGFASYLIACGFNSESVIVGYDKRFLSEYFAVAVAEVLSGNGFHVYLTDKATPTPVISYSIVDKQTIGGVNITASHNPPSDNGFKVRNEFGGALPPKDLEIVESLIPDDVSKIKRTSYQDSLQNHRIELFDPNEAYIQQLRSMVDIEVLKSAGLKVQVDPMWGNGVGWFPMLFKGGKTKVFEIHNDRNPLFPDMIRPEPIPPNVNSGLRETINNQADVLIITDGDADRLGVGDEHGEFIDQLRVFGLLAFYLLEVLGMRGPIVKTLSTTNMLNKLGQIYQVPVYETGVGFKYVAPKMLETHAMIGGEESGGYAFHGHVPERDGILAGLYLLDLMVKLNKKPSELLNLLFSKVGKHYYERIDTVFTGDKAKHEEMIVQSNPQKIGGLKVLGLETIDGYKFNLEDGGWLLIRFSGTEPIVRVYTETTHREKVKAILEDGLRIVGLK